MPNDFPRATASDPFNAFELTKHVEIFHGRLSDYSEYYERFLASLQEGELLRAENMKNNQLRKRYVTVRGSLRHLLGNALNLVPNEIDLGISDYGKPFLIHYPEVSFNLSHSDNEFLIAYSANRKIGVDIEKINERMNFFGLIDKCFAEEEKDFWHALPPERKKPEFYRLWTIKEAFVKAVGRGLALGLKNCVINPKFPAEFIQIPPEYGISSQWAITEIDVGSAYCAALVTDNPGVSIEIIDKF